MTALDLKGNADVDQLAKGMASKHTVPVEQWRMVRRESGKLVAIARWLGMATEIANSFPFPDPANEGKVKHLRDSMGLRPRPKPKPRVRPAAGVTSGVKRKGSSEDSGAQTTGDLSRCARWAQLRERVRRRLSSAPT